ncbi:uncharacterized protein NEMAJ01_2358 [Nematocida major]|uniref:uncharacterized protein n=1 Tax=Nematocida major TaxID=1912982 RepID=UPI00200813F3|nr:uncharacterized protein NEMAJ01_2358 [Nematocida major]KAH9387462.1 hypothetical protein NEMAJ01_2358 [Nematocida major]
MLPAYTSVRACKRGQTEFLKETFSNCVETGLFALFCCLAHDPAQNEYDADTMLSKTDENEKTEDLRNFFRLESVTPKQCATKEAMQEWNRVVSDLQSEHIAYVRDSRNEVRSGIFNMLYIVAEIAGRPEEEKLRIRKLAQMLEDFEIDEDFEDVIEKTQEYVEELFALLSVNGRLQVKFSDLMVDARSDGQKDLYGKITLKYTDKDSVVEQGICLAFKPGHLTVTLCPWVFLSLTDEKKEAFFATDSCSEPKTFAECLFAKYAGVWMARGMDPQGDKLAEDIREATISLLSPGASAHPNQLFLLGSALRYEKIQDIAEHFTLHAAANGIELAQEHTAVRLLSNLLGSLPLDDYAAQYDALGNIVCLDMLGRLFPKIALSKETFAIFYRNPYSILDIWKYTGTNSAPAGNAIIKYFREYKKQVREPLFRFYALENFPIISRMFPVFLADKSTRHIDEIRALIMDVDGKAREKALDAKALFDLLLFLASLKNKGIPPDLMFALGSRVVPRSIQACNRANCMILVNSQTASAILEALNTHQSTLQQMPSGEEVFKIVQGILQPIINRWA